jgi:hypothetical protein
MSCPVIRFLPEIVAATERVKNSQTEVELLAVAKGMCLACRSKTPGSQCPQGEEFGCALQDRLPDLVEMIQKEAGKRTL